jgi:hypothetical protein
MSPVEAAYMTLAVLHQKLYNPEFQLTQEERRSAWIERHSKSATAGEKPASEPSISATAKARQQEMEGVLRRAASAISSKDLDYLPGKALDVLGIER